MKKLLASLALLAACSASPAAVLLDVGVTDRDSGRRLETYSHRGRLYVVGTPGKRYAVSLRNRSGGRLLAVLSVDGVNAVSGETASPAQTGYVLAPGQAAEVAGWRKSRDEVAAFYFTRLPDSYAARTDRPDNVGVIGIAVFRESEPPRPATAPPLAREKQAADAASRADAAGSPRAEAAPAESRLGTGHGERLSAPAEYTDFIRASERPAEMLAIYYDSRANLIARGIIPAAPRAPLPDPFPAGFVPDPRG